MEEKEREAGRRRKKNEIRLTNFNLTWHHIQLVSYYLASFPEAWE